MGCELGNLYSSTKDARKILVVDLGFLGDAVHLVPALWEIKRAYPQAELHVLTSFVGAELLRLAPCVDRVWVVELHAGKRTVPRQLKLIGSLRSQRFDLALNLGGGDRSIFLTWLSGARVRVGHESARKHLWKHWLIPIWVPRQDPLLAAYEQRRQALRACGIPLSGPVWNLCIPEDARQKAERLVPEGSIHFSINASIPLKEWPAGHWAELSKSLLTADPVLRIIASGSTGLREQARLCELADTVASDRLKVLPQGLSIAELAAMVRRCQLHVGGDSGVLHLAAALEVPTVGLYRQYEDVSAWLPVGTAHRVLMSPCACVNQRNGPCALAGPALCLAKIEPAQVAGMIWGQLGKPALASAPESSTKQSKM